MSIPKLFCDWEHQLLRRGEWLRLIGRLDLKDKRSKSYIVCEEHFLPKDILRNKRTLLLKDTLPCLKLPVSVKKESAKHIVLEAFTQTEDTKAQNPTNSNKDNINEIPIGTELNDRIVSILKHRVDEMTEDERNCSVIFSTTNFQPNIAFNMNEQKLVGFHEVDGVQSTELANEALVVIASGLFVDWIQPIGYALLSSTKGYEKINKWIDKVLIELIDIGLFIRTLVSDIRSDFYKAATDRGVSTENPYFELKNTKIYYIFDVSHLVKYVRANLTLYDIHFQHGIAKNEHIVHFYNQDKLKTYRLAPKLTDSHIYASDFITKEISFSTDVFSNPVAAGISTYIDFKAIEESGRETVKFIKLMNDTFDAFNSDEKIKSNMQALTGKDSQSEFFNEILNVFRSMKLVNPKDGKEVKSSDQFIEGFQITIGSILRLLDDLKSEDSRTLLTRRLTLDAIIKFVGELKRGKESSGNLKSIQFISEFQKLFFSNISKFPAAEQFPGNSIPEHFNQISDSKNNIICDAYSDSDPATNEDIDIKEFIKSEVIKAEHDIVIKKEIN